MDPARSFRTTRSHASAWAPGFAMSRLSREKPPMRSLSLWQVTQYLSRTALGAGVSATDSVPVWRAEVCTQKNVTATAPTAASETVDARPQIGIHSPQTGLIGSALLYAKAAGFTPDFFEGR